MYRELIYYFNKLYFNLCVTGQFTLCVIIVCICDLGEEEREKDPCLCKCGIESMRMRVVWVGMNVYECTRDQISEKAKITVEKKE